MTAPRISIVVPAKNEACTLGSVLDRVRSLGDELLVVDGHSTDSTAAIARERGIPVFLDHGRGKGDAVRSAADHVKGDIIVFIDADGSHDPNDIPRLIAPIINNEADLVIGSRMRGGSDELHSSVFEAIRLIGSTLITQAINLRFGVRLTDYQNGFRAIRTEVLKRLGCREEITTIEQEMAIKALGLGYRVVEIPAHESVRQGGSSKISVFRVAHRYGFQLLRDLARPWPHSARRNRSA
jgi:dolichol-phosphate hexosyltransferase